MSWLDPKRNVPTSCAGCDWTSATFNERPSAARTVHSHRKSRNTGIRRPRLTPMTTGERRPHKSRKAWNLWIIAAFALMPVALAVGLWGIATHGGGAGRLVFSTVASVLVLVGIL